MSGDIRDSGVKITTHLLSATHQTHHHLFTTIADRRAENLCAPLTDVINVRKKITLKRLYEIQKTFVKREEKHTSPFPRSWRIDYIHKSLTLTEW